MKKTTSILVWSCLLAGSVFLAAGSAFASEAVTENECVHAGGHVTEGSGCKFCVGGKLDMAEIKDSGKKGQSRSNTDKKTAGKPQGETGSKNSVEK